jgi:putative intracellular protease/amidase
LYSHKIKIITVIAISIERYISKRRDMQIVFLFYDRMTALDAVGPHEVLSRLPGAGVKRVALMPGPVRSDSGLILTAEHPLSDVSHADVLLIPGAGNATALRDFPEILE